MDLKSRHKADPSFNTSSMTDIVFLLLIFFMLTSNVATTGLTIDRPTSSQAKIESVKEIVTIDKNQNIYFSTENKKVTLSELEKLLKSRFSKLKNDKVNNTIVINGDKKSDYGIVIDVFNIANTIENARAVLVFDKP